MCSTTSVANFGWGVGATAGDVNCYWGNCVLSSTQSDRLTDLSGNMMYHYRKLMKKSHAKLFSLDNYQIGQELKDISMNLPFSKEPTSAHIM
jgi:hypothetical protein